MIDHESLQEKSTLFFVSLFAFLLLGIVGYFLYDSTKSVKVIEPISQPFKVCTGFKVVKPGAAICYVIHYHKYFDYPGDLSKQLIIKSSNGDETYIALDDSAGHLPVGIVKKTAYTRIPDYAPEGVGVLKLTASYHIGKLAPPVVAYTEQFEIRK